MTAPRPPQPSVMQLIQKRRKQSIRQAAATAGISEARWRQLESGARSTPLGYAPEPAPPGTLARMARAAGVTPAELRENGEDEAAVILEELIAEHAAQADADEEAAAAGARAASEVRGLSARQRAALAAMIADDLRTLRGSD
jgi:transcriptional regulator with XRE-family HTH domain